MHTPLVTICPYKLTKAISMSFRYEWLNDLKIKRNELFATSFVCYTDALLAYRVDALFFKVFVLVTDYTATPALSTELLLVEARG